MFTYTASVTIRPRTLRPGTKAEGAVRFSNVQGGKIARAYASYPGLGQVKLDRMGEDRYGLSATVPKRAPAGTFTGYVHARSDTGARGPRIPVRLTIWA